MRRIVGALPLGRKSGDGQAILELAMTLPLVVGIIMAVLELGFVFNAYTTVVAAARHGARAGAVYLYKADPALDRDQNIALNKSNRETGAPGALAAPVYQDNVTATVARSMGSLRSGLTYDLNISYTPCEMPVDSGSGDLITVQVVLHYHPLTGFFGDRTINLTGQSSERLE